jgi:hypothetical protein
MASAWLEGQRDNRKISPNVVARYARVMGSGDWLLNGEDIVFSKRGRLMNGQHRLTACIESGAPFKALIVVGVEDSDKLMASFDGGWVRSGAQVLQMAGYTSTAILSAMADLVFKYENGIRANQSIDALTRLQVVVANPDMIEHTYVAHKAAQVFRHFPSSAFAGLAYLFNKASEKDAQVFLERFIEGTGLEVGMPVAALRKTAERAAQDRGTVPTGHWIQLIIKAWNATQAGEEIKTLKMTPSLPSFLDIAGLPREVHDTTPIISTKGRVLKPKRTVKEPSVPSLITPRIVRAWAADNGYAISGDGPVPRAVISAFEIAMKQRAQAV